MDRLSVSFLIAILLHLGFFLGTAILRVSENDLQQKETQAIKIEMLPRVVIPENYQVVKHAVPAPTGPRKAKAPSVAKSPTPGAVSTNNTNAVAMSPEGSGSGESGNGLTQITLEQLKSGLKSEIRARIESKVIYPSMSRRLGHTGKVVVGFTMLKDGTIINIHVHEGCPFDRLNEAAIEAVQRAGKFRPIPEELQLTQMDMNVPVVFKQI